MPDEWDVEDGYVLNGEGEKVIDFKASNLHIVSYSEAVDKIVDANELLRHTHTLPKFPKIPTGHHISRRIGASVALMN